MKGLWLRFWRMVSGRRAERDIEDELRFHVEMETEKNRRAGLPEKEARRRALVAFGGEARWREEVRRVRGTAWMEETARDLRHSVRALIRAPGFAVAAIGTIALGVGATTAIYSVTAQVVLAPLPYPESDELVRVWERNPERGVEQGLTSWPNFSDWRDASTTLELAAIVPSRVNLTGFGEPEQVEAAAVSRGFFEIIGAPLALGRSFRDEEVEGPFGNHVVLSHDLFTRRFGADPTVIGRLVEIDGATYEVIGVTEVGRGYPRDVDVWTPVAFGTGRLWREPRNRRWISAVGRLDAEATLASASQEMNAIAQRLENDHPDVNRGARVALVSLHDSVVGDVRAPMLLLLGAVGLVLLIAVVNVANLLLAKGTARAREVAARMALGAGRERVVRQALVDSALLGVIGGVVGAAVAAFAVSGLLATAPAHLPRLDEVRVDGLVLLVSLLVSMAASVAFGVLPALHASRVDPGSSLRNATRGSTAHGLSRLSGLFVGGQFALAFVLLFGSGLLMRSFLNLRALDAGFEPEGVARVAVALPGLRYPGPESRHAFGNALIEQVTSLPDVESAATISSFFLTADTRSGDVTIESRPEAFGPGEGIPVVTDAVSPGFFETARMRLVAGRDFLVSDGPDDVSVAVVNESFARAYLDGLDPIGQRYTWGRPYGEDTRWFTIVGVVADARRSGLDAPVRPTVFVPVAQSARMEVELWARTTDDPSAIVPALRSAVRAIDPELPLTRVGTLDAAVSESLAQRRLVTWLIGLFALAAVTLAAVGIFGVMAYLVGRRTREIGIRVALGAARERVLGEILREGMLQALAGLAVGVVGAFALAGVVRSQLYGLGPTDPVTFVATAMILVAVAALACMVPARRAATVDALEALREE